MKLSPILTGEINSILTLRHSLNCVDDVLFSLIPNASHLSTQTITFLNLHHFVKRFNSICLSCSVDVTRAKSSSNWNQVCGDNELQKSYPIRRILSSSLVLIKVLILMLNNKGLKQPPSKTTFPTISESVIYI